MLIEAHAASTPYKSHVTIMRCQSPSFTVLLLTKNLTSTVGIGSRILSSNSVLGGGGGGLVWYIFASSHV